MAQLMPSLKNITWERLVREGRGDVSGWTDPGQAGQRDHLHDGFFPTEGAAAGKIVPAHVLPPDRTAR